MKNTLPVTGNTTRTRPENRAFYPALDGLRALALLMVFLQHYLAQPWGFTGVDVFFVLSGFLITGILWDSRSDTYRVRNFYVRRTLRIFPLYYGVMLAVLVSQPLFHWQWNWKWLVWPAYIGNFARFVHPYLVGDPMQRLADFQIKGTLGTRQTTLFLGHFWSLCVEEQFYLIWPWFVFYIRSRRVLLWICASSVFVCLALRLWGSAVLPGWMLDNEVLYRATPFRLDALLFGGFLALMLRGPSREALLRYVRMIAPFVAVAFLAWVVFSSYGHIWGTHYVYPAWKFTWGLTAVDILAGIAILLAIQPGTVVYRIFRVKPLRWVGRISYGAYVFHDIPHLLYSRFGYGLYPKHAGIAVSAVALVSTLAIAHISFRFFESPFLNLKERWTLGRPPAETTELQN